jgi:hypothetical protein
MSGSGVLAGSQRVSAQATRSNYTIRRGTDEETAVYVTDSGEPGPTVMVVGGMHGDEPNGFTSAGKIREWNIDAGRLVALPKANVKGIQAETRCYDDDTDLNRQFPSGSEPTTALAREIWDVIVNEDIDFLIDLHSSYGIYNSGDGGVGQGIFSTQAGDATSYRKDLISYMNTHYVTDSTYAFDGATSTDGSRPMLKHKVGADLDTGAMIIETTRKNDRPLDVKSDRPPPSFRSSSSGYVTPVNTDEDGNDEASGLQFGVTNTFEQNATITALGIAPEDTAIDQLRDHSYGEGKWVSEPFIQADVQNGTADIDNGTALPCTIDLDADGFETSVSNDAILSAGSSATVSLYQFKSDGSPIDMVGEPVEIDIDYTVDGTNRTRTFTLLP